MSVATEKKLKLEISYNGVTRTVEVEPEERVTALLQKAIAIFGITQNAHLLALFRQNGTEVLDNESVERAGLKPGEVLLLRPSAVRGGGVLRLGKNILSLTFQMFRECGRGECECVAYWTGPTDQHLADGVEHPTHKRSSIGYEIDDRWLTNFWQQLANAKRSIKAQIHTHPAQAFHSGSDDKWPIVSQPGFLSIVIPDFAEGAVSLNDAWVGRLDQSGKWQRLESAADGVRL